MILVRTRAPTPSAILRRLLHWSSGINLPWPRSPASYAKLLPLFVEGSASQETVHHYSHCRVWTRLVLGWEVTVNTVIIPMWVSVLGLVIAGGLAWLLWLEDKRARTA